MARSLASIQKIESVRPIPDADAIEVVRVLGWDVVVRKDLNYKPGDVVCMFEIDSILPDLPVFDEMLRGKPWSPRAARLKTVTLRGQVSQGYVRHAADIFGEAAVDYPVGTDVTEVIGVTKYEPPATNEQAANLGHWLSPRVPKTDEDRIQSKPKLVDSLQGEPYVITIKLDGQSATYGFDDEGQFWSCSRGFRLKPGRGGTWEQMAEKYNLRHVLEGTDLVIQGEVCGPGIQGNRLGLKEVDLFVFNIFDKVDATYFCHDDVRYFCRTHGLKMVPMLERGGSFNYTADELLRLAEGTYSNGHPREGIVIRHATQTGIDRISMKAISNSFLLSTRT